MQTARLWFDVEFDENITDAESLSNAFEILLETAMSTPGILDEYGNPEVGRIWVSDDLEHAIEVTACEEILRRSMKMTKEER